MTASLHALGVTPDMRLAVAVSGGVDSITLAHLLWHCHPRDNLVFFTVDHRLRDTSTREAAEVAALISGWGGRCDVLSWEEAAGGAGLQERARMARYCLLGDAARAADCKTLLLGHHADDQAETFWMRLADGSGLSGLGGMQASRVQDGITWLRPLLASTRTDIVAYAQEHALPVINDPSNANQSFLRVRLRGFADQLAAEGLGAQRLSRTMAKLRRADDALAELTTQFVRAQVKQHSGGALYFAHADFAALPLDLRRRVLQAVLQAMTPRDYPPSYDAALSLAQRLGDRAAATANLGGCMLTVSRGMIWVLREPVAAAKLALDAAVGDSCIFDHRFAVQGLAALAGQGLVLAVLGEAGIADLGAQKDGILWTEDFKNAPASIKRGVAALWQGQKLLAVPQLSWRTGGFTQPLPDIRPYISLGDIV